MENAILTVKFFCILEYIWERLDVCFLNTTFRVNEEYYPRRHVLVKIKLLYIFYIPDRLLRYYSATVAFYYFH